MNCSVIHRDVGNDLGSAVRTTESEVIDIILGSSVYQVHLDIEFVDKSPHKVAKLRKGTEKWRM